MTARPPDFNRFACPIPRRDAPHVVLGHGGGGKLTSELIEQVFLPAFGGDLPTELRDSVVLDVPTRRLAFSTDSYVIQPLFFPGGSIGVLAVNGTVNDLAMSGAKPMFLSTGFIVEEGFPIEDLERIAREMGDAARTAGVSIVCGDTKVIERGRGDGCYINTSGIGVVPEGIHIAPSRAEPGDAVIVSGTLGDHGMAVMSVREGLAFDAPIESDSAPLNELVEHIVQACSDVHVLRDPTRGGLAASLNEIAAASRCGIALDEPSLPIRDVVQSACDILGLDPLFVANEGKLICFVPGSAAETVLRAMQAHPLGKEARIIGRVVTDHPGMVVARTAIGTSRVVATPIGEQLPRIC